MFTSSAWAKALARSLLERESKYVEMNTDRLKLEREWLNFRPDMP